MNHSFVESKIDKAKCAHCRRSFADHTEFAVCESATCSNMGKMELWPNSKDENAMLLCENCIAKEKAHQSSDNQAARLAEARATIPNIANPTLKIENLVDRARTLDYRIQVRADIYNAETIASHEVFSSIDADTNINNKQFAKGQFLNDRLEQLNSAIFDEEEKISELRSRQRVMQQMMNELANTLREEERTKLTVLSPDYKPGKVSKPTKTTRSPKKPTFDKAELIKQAQILQSEGYPIQMSNLQNICVQRDMTPLQAAGVVRTMMGEMK